MARSAVRCRTRTRSAPVTPPASPSATRTPMTPAPANRTVGPPPVRVRATRPQVSVRTRRLRAPAGPMACPVSSAASGALCEFADGFCFPQGSRTVVVNGVQATASARTNECFADRYQNGDLDFDGQSYVAESGRMAARTIRPRSSTPGRLQSAVTRIRRSSSRPTSADPRTSVTPRPEPGARSRR